METEQSNLNYYTSRKWVLTEAETETKVDTGNGNENETNQKKNKNKRMCERIKVWAGNL